MYMKIKKLADEALALQNKDLMDVALRTISAACEKAAEAQPADDMAFPSPRESGAANALAEVAGVANRKPAKKGASQ